MKKFLSIVLAVCSLLTFASCAMGKSYEATAKDFSIDGMTVTLTEAFKESSYEGYEICYESNDTAVFVVREKFSAAEGFSEMTLEDYAAIVHESNSARNPDEVKTENGLTSMEYKFYNEQEKITYKYFTTMFKGDDSFWLVQFACNENLYEEFKPHFVDWAKTVDVSAK